MSNKGLPDYEIDENKHYSGEDMRHIVAREVMKHRMDKFENDVSRLALNASEQYSKLESMITRLFDMVDNQRQSHREDTQYCKKELRDEIERDFATKEDVAEMKGSIRTTQIVMGMIQTVVFLLLAAWIRSKGGV